MAQPTLRPITEVADEAGIRPDELELHGSHIAKIDLGILSYRLHDTPHLDNWHLRVYGGLGLAAFALADYDGSTGSTVSRTGFDA